jgi:hypothetical protein
VIYYRVYGLTFRSDSELPGLDRIQETSAVDYTLRIDPDPNRFGTLRRAFRRPWYTSRWRLKSGRTTLQVWKTEDCRKFLFHFYDRLEFIVDRGRQHIWVDGLREASLQAAIHHLLFSLPGFLLGLHKSACLHGAAIGWGDSAIALLGKSRSGKSALSAVMAARGFDVLSDDLVALGVTGDTVKVHPGYPWIALRPDCLHWLGADRDAGQSHSEWHYLDEAYVTRQLHRRSGSCDLKPRQLKGIYLLDGAQDPESQTAIGQIARHHAFMALMEAADRTHIPCRAFKLQEFSLMGSVVAGVPIHGLRYHLSADGLIALSDLLAQLPELSQTRQEVEA